MIRGGKILLASCSLVMAGCVASHDVKVRPIADTAANYRYGGGLIAQARAQLALGNAGLALETFRKMQREQPESADAFAGIAACYAAMGRYDLTRTNYEFALAYAPNDPALLNALASTLDRLGQSEQAAQIRSEVAQLSASSMAQANVAERATPLGVPRIGSVLVNLPPPTPIHAEGKETAVVMAAMPQPSMMSPPPAGAAVLNKSAPKAIKDPSFPAQIKFPIVTAVATVKLPPKLEVAANANRTPIAPIAKPQIPSAAVDLPPVPTAVLDKPALVAKVIRISDLTQTSVGPSLSAPPRPRPMPVVRPRETQTARVEVRADHGPYLERISRGEVSLVTSQPSVRVAQVDLRVTRLHMSAQAIRAGQHTAPDQPTPRPILTAGLRWLPLRYASASANIQLLNAARSEGLAARMRVALVDRGWRKIRIGNARQIHQRSLVLYSPERAGIARRLAAQFRCKAIKRLGIDRVIVLLGQDRVLARTAASRA